MTNYHHLPFLPVSLAALSECPSFTSKDPRVVRAGLWMMDAAWRSVFPGSIPSAFEPLSQITRLTESEVATNFEVLTAGWVLQEDGRLHHLQLEELVESLHERFGTELAVFGESAVIACQGGTAQFELLPSDEIKKKKRGKTAFPKDFVFDTTTLAAVIEEGYKTSEQQNWLVAEVRNYALAEDKRQSNWQATIRKFMGSGITRDKFRGKFGFVLGQQHSSELVPNSGETISARQRLARASTQIGPLSFAQKGAMHNSSLMASAVARRFPAPAAGDASQSSPGMSP